MIRTTLQLRRWVGSPRSRHDAQRRLAVAHLRDAAQRLDAAVRTLEARGHDVANALAARTAAERALLHLVDSRSGASSDDDTTTPIAVASDLLDVAAHDLRVAQRRRTSAAERVAQARDAFDAALSAQQRIHPGRRTNDVLAGVSRG